MSFSAELTTISGVFKAGFEATHPTIKIAWPNAPFDKPVPNEPWVRFALLNGDAFQASMGAPGANTYRHVGVIDISIYVPEKWGEAPARSYADEIAAIFRNYNSGGIRCRAPRLRVLGNSIDEAWYRITVSIPFERDSKF